MTQGAIYQVGTLKYTKGALTALFVWLLWGDFCYNLMLQVMPQLLPLFLARFDASSLLISILLVMLPEAVNLVLNPIISTMSDRTRSKWGRRRPYLLFSTPFLSLFLLLLGWSSEIGAWLHRLVFADVISVNYVILGVAAVLVFSYKIVEIFCNSVLYYIFNDVVPHQFIGTFMALFRMIGVTAIFLFQRYLMGFADDYMPWIFTGAAVLYFVGMTAMCLAVKEGEYPPVDPVESKASFAGNIRLYFEECYSSQIYIWFFLGVSINTVSTSCRSVFNVLFATKELGMTTGEFGNVMSYYQVVIFILMLPVGYLSDKISPLLLYIIGGLLITLVNVFGFYFVNDYNSFLWFTVMLGVVYVFQTATYLPMHMKILPQSKYGQFCSAGVIVRSTLMIFVSGLSGWFIDVMGLYRYLFVWDFFFTIVGTACLWMAYLYWRKLGGADGSYTAPVVVPKS